MCSVQLCSSSGTKVGVTHSRSYGLLEDPTPQEDQRSLIIHNSMQTAVSEE